MSHNSKTSPEAIPDEVADKSYWGDISDAEFDNMTFATKKPDWKDDFEGLGALEDFLYSSGKYGYTLPAGTAYRPNQGNNGQIYYRPDAILAYDVETLSTTLETGQAVAAKGFLRKAAEFIGPRDDSQCYLAIPLSLSQGLNMSAFLRFGLLEYQPEIGEGPLYRDERVKFPVMGLVSEAVNNSQSASTNYRRESWITTLRQPKNRPTIKVLGKTTLQPVSGSFSQRAYLVSDSSATVETPFVVGRSEVTARDESGEISQIRRVREMSLLLEGDRRYETSLEMAARVIKAARGSVRPGRKPQIN